MRKTSLSRKIFVFSNTLFMIFMVFITLYPMLYVLFASVSVPSYLATFKGFLYRPLGFTLNAYELVLRNGNILRGYRNTLVYLVLGLTVNMSMTTVGAYVLSRKDLLLGKVLLWICLFTMFFGGGLIPTFLVVKDLGMIDTIWALIIPGAISTYNLLVLRTAFMTVPDALEESARLDGANDLVIMIRILVPLIIPSMVVIVLYYAVGIWNSWFSASIYLLRKTKLYPLQMILRDILIKASADYSLQADAEQFSNINEIIKYATIVIATVPILCVYPFLQRYFVKGVMIGAVKG